MNFSQKIILKKNSNDNEALEEKIDSTIQNVTENIDNFHYNKSVANLYELVNLIQKIITKGSVSNACLLDAFKKLSLLLQPFTPHLSEGMWEKLGTKDLAINQTWPKHSGIQRKKASKIAVQINGKTKEILEFNIGIDKEKVKIKALNNKKIKKMISGKAIKKTIFVPEKILNIVLK